jgi:hypothetical protein
MSIIKLAYDAETPPDQQLLPRISPFKNALLKPPMRPLYNPPAEGTSGLPITPDTQFSMRQYGAIANVNH